MKILKPAVLASLLAWAIFTLGGVAAYGETVVGWGWNGYGQTNPPGNLINAVRLSAGYGHSVALRSDGTVVAWGDSTSDQTPAPADLTNVVSLASGDNFSVALRQDGSVSAWGNNGAGQVSVPSFPTNVTAIGAGREHALAVLADGRVVGWGRNEAGQLAVPAGLDNAIAVSAGEFHSLALTRDGQVVVWGITNGSDVWGVKQLPAGLDTVVAIASGYNHNLALKADGSVVAWGQNSGSANVPAAATNVVAIAASGAHSLALKADGGVVVWGSANDGLANVPADLTNVVGIAAGVQHSLALVGDAAPRILLQPQSRTGFSGASLTLHVAAVGGQPLAYQWRHGGGDLLGSTKRVLTFTNLTPADAGSYQVVVSNSLGSVVSSNATLVVVEAPPIVIQDPTNQLGWTGHAATFGVTAAGSQPLHFQWYFNATNVLAGATNAALALTNLTTAHQGGYAVVIENAFGAVTSAVANLTVQGIVEALNDTNLVWNVGGDAPWVVSLTNTADGIAAAQAGALNQNQESVIETTVTGPGTLTFWWNRPAVLPSVSYTFADNGVGLAQLVTTGWQKQTHYLGAGEHQLRWRCVNTAASVTTTPGGLDQVTYVPGPSAPLILASPANLSRPAGMDAAFYVSAAGTPPLNYQWYFNSNALPAATNVALNLVNVQTNNAGKYYVSVANAYGGTNSGSATLAVAPTAPVIVQPPVGLSTWPGAATTLSASFYGSTPMSHQWRLNNTNVPGATNAVLSFPSVQFADGGNYTLFLSNAYGTRLSSPAAALNVAEVAAWGAGVTNSFGTNVGQCIVPNGLSNVLAVAGGVFHSLALKSDGGVAAWGYNSYGQTNAFVPATNVAAIAAGWGHNLILRSNGTLVAWGYYGYGLTTIPFGLTNVAGIAAGWYHNVVVRSNGTLAAWGLNTFGQTNVPPGLSNVVAVAAGANHSLALKADGTVVGWGWDANGLTNTPTGLDNVVAIAAGASNNLALKLDGTVVAWGANSFGQGTVPAGLSNVIAIAAGGAHNLALRDDGSVVAWGLNNFRQTNVPAGLPLTAGLAAGNSHSLVALGGNAPRLVRPPLDHFSYANYPAYLNAAAVGAAPLDYQWRRAGTNVPGATNATLSYPVSQPADGGFYQLVVTNGFGGVTSAPVQLTILPSQPNFVAQPANLAVVPGSNATFIAGVSSPWPTTYQWQFDGLDLPNATNLSLTLTNVQPAHEGYYTLVASNLNGLATSSAAYLNVLDLGEALDATNLTWTTWGEVPWKPTGTSVYTPPAAVQCGPLVNGRGGSLQTAVVGPGTLSFRWQESAYGNLNFRLNGDVKANAQSLMSWQQQTFYLPAGTQVLTWEGYATSTLPITGNTYLDAVSYVPGPTAAAISSPPASRIVPAGTNVTLSVSAIGTPPLYYQWQFNGTNLPNTGASLALNDVQAEMAGLYRVTVSNAYGSQTSPDATLTVTPSAPTLSSQPVNQQQLVGGAVSFTASATGTRPLSYQWRFNGADVPGATSPTLTLADVQTGQMGNYTVAVSNAVGTAVSTNATLFVYALPDLAAVLGGGDIVWNTGTNAPWFPQTNVTHDGVSAAQSGQLPGTSQSSVLTGVVNGPATLTFWWKVSCDSFWSSLAFAVNGASQASLVGEVDWQPKTILLGSGANTLQWTLTRGFGGPATDRGWLDEVILTPGWTAVTLVSEPTNRTVTAGTTATFSAAATGTPPFRYQWQFEGVNLADATNATLTLSNVQTNHVGAYSVIVSNDYSGAASSNAFLTVTPSGPVLTSQPGSRLLACNGTTTFAATARGSTPLTYQWLFNSNAIPAATNASLVRSALQPADAGAYSVVVSNAYGTAMSSNAWLMVERRVVLDYSLPHLYPRPAPTGLTNVVAVAAGGQFSLALRDDGTVTAWGDNTYGQTNVPPGLNDIVAIAAGSGHGLALRADGTVAAWGNNTYGQTNVPGDLTGVTAIASADFFNLALRADGTVVRWGDDGDGQLTPPAGLSNVVSIAAGRGYAAAVKRDGTAVFWGGNFYGQSSPPFWLNYDVADVALGACRSWFHYQDDSVENWGYGAGEHWGGVAVLAAAGVDTMQDFGAAVTYGGTVLLDPLGSPFSYLSANFPSNAATLALGPNHLLVVFTDGSPFLARRLHDRTVVAGDTTVFASGVVAAGPVTCQWQRNFTDLPGATNVWLVLTNTPLSAAGSYRCIVSNALGRLTTPAATLQVERSTPRFVRPETAPVNGGGFTLTLGGLSGHGDIVLSASTNLADWVPLWTNPPVLGTWQFTDDTAAGSPVKFYRVEER